MYCNLCYMPLSDGMVLSNGIMIHKACLKEKEQRLNEIEKNIEQTKRDIAKNTRMLDKSRSLIYRFFISFTGSYAGPKIMEQRIIMLKENLKAFYDEQKVIQGQLKRVYDFLLYYPPDWDERRALVRERDQCCKKCGKYSAMLDQFHVHHRIPLSQGGSNKIENLILLCDKCHKRIHGVDSFSYLPSEERKTCPEKILKIQQALQEGHKVEFLQVKGAILELYFNGRPLFPTSSRENRLEYPSKLLGTKIRPYDLRHNFALLWVKKGGDVFRTSTDNKLCLFIHD